MKKIALLFILNLALFGVEFKVATYNVENLFDLSYNRTEYKEYKPHTKTWNRYTLEKKLKNIAKVIKDLKPDIIALQEIESKKALYLLNQKLRYKYSYFLKNNSSAVGVAILSKYKIVENKQIDIKVFDTYARPILRSTINIDGKNLIVYVNHWRSKRASESKRIPYAYALKHDIDKLDEAEDYIIVGDLNENYNEFETFKHNRKLNDTFGITAINQILNTTIGKNFVTKKNIFIYTNERVYYNLWLELDLKDRFSVLFKTNRSTPDNIIISKGLLDNKNISYVNNSFGVFKPKYLLNHNKISRWNIKKAKGYSDHLPIYAIFSTNSFNSYSDIKKQTIKKEFFIDDLYNISYLHNPILLKNCVVIYKKKPYTIIKQQNHRAIVIYNKALDLKVGCSYDIVVSKIDSFNNLKEIKDILDYRKKGCGINYTNYYKKGIDIFDIKYQNEIIYLRGIYKKGYLYLPNRKKIKLFFDKTIYKKLDIKDGTPIVIKSGHLTTFKSHNQITIHKLDDIRIVK